MGDISGEFPCSAPRYRTGVKSAVANGIELWGSPGFPGPGSATSRPPRPRPHCKTGPTPGSKSPAASPGHLCGLAGATPGSRWPEACQAIDEPPYRQGRAAQGQQEEPAPDAAPDQPLIKPGNGERRGDLHPQGPGQTRGPEKPDDDAVRQASQGWLITPLTCEQNDHTCVCAG